MAFGLPSAPRAALPPITPIVLRRRAIIAVVRIPVRLSLLALVLATGCVSIQFGRPFPSPEPASIKVGATDKEGLRRVFGEPYQVGLDSGDQTWRWFHGQREGGAEITKDFTVRFGADGTVKSYSFTSNFPDDMRRLK
jgi:hypothetical protein